MKRRHLGIAAFVSPDVYWIIAAILLFAPTASAYACSCTETPSVQSSFDAASAVFLGEVTIIANNVAQLPQNQVTFVVREQFKGEAKAQLELRTASIPTACGYPFQVGEQYVVYAEESAGGLRTSLCSRTRRVEDAHEDLTILRAVSSKK